MDLCINGKCVESTLVSEMTITCQDLEGAIEVFATTGDDDVGLLDIAICSRTDCHLLECRQTIIPVQSTLGILEEVLEDHDDINLVNPLVVVTLFEASGSAQAPRTIWYPPSPHSDWTRIPSKAKKEKDPDRRHKMLWLDLQRTAEKLTGPADCCHFLRSLLGSSHHASPWGDGSDEEPFDTVAVVFNGSSDVLEKFRTSDASPSYFTHSISRLQIPAADPYWWVHNSTPNQCKKCDVSLIVYKRLPPRDAYALINEEDPSATLPEGCMWETFCRQADNDDDEDGKIIMQDYWRQVAPPYINHQQDYPNLLEPLIEQLQTIRDEALSIPTWPAWPERNHYSSNPLNPDAPAWTVFPLCHCFPANQVENRKWIKTTCAFAPKTTSLLRALLGDHLRTALFSRLNPETTLEAHTGWKDLANHVYRIHLPLVVPPGGLCGTWVDGAVETHHEGRPLCFDDSKVHRAFNYSKADRIVLILDIARPLTLPNGTATGGHTDELDDFINSLS